MSEWDPAVSMTGGNDADDGDRVGREGCIGEARGGFSAGWDNATEAHAGNKTAGEGGSVSAEEDARGSRYNAVTERDKDGPLWVVIRGWVVLALSGWCRVEGDGVMADGISEESVERT
jgi:hypothetical protein